MKDDKTTTVEFEGILSGGHECFVWAVDEDTYRRIAKPVSNKETEFDSNRFHENLYSLYPSHIFGFKEGKVRVKIRFEEI